MKFNFTIDTRPRLGGKGAAIARWTNLFGNELHSFEIPDGRVTLTDQETAAGDAVAVEELRRRARG
jgi:hypothetical protein